MSTCSHLHVSRRVDLMEKRCLLVYICHLNKSTLGIGDVDLFTSVISTSRLTEFQMSTYPDLFSGQIYSMKGRIIDVKKSTSEIPKVDLLK